jgi:hypothetical protein
MSMKRGTTFAPYAVHGFDRTARLRETAKAGPAEGPWSLHTGGRLGRSGYHRVRDEVPVHSMVDFPATIFHHRYRRWALRRPPLPFVSLHEP